MEAARSRTVARGARRAAFTGREQTSPDLERDEPHAADRLLRFRNRLRADAAAQPAEPARSRCLSRPHCRADRSRSSRPAVRLSARDETDIDIVSVEAEDALSPRLCRYDLHRHVAAPLQAPILYVDVDIVFDRPVLPMLDAVGVASRICFPAETASMVTSHAMGGNLLRAAGRIVAGPGFHTGTIGLAHGAAGLHHATLARIAETKRALRTARPALFRQWIDQPVANDLRAMSDNTLFDTQTLAPFFRRGFRDDEPRPDADSRRGAVHFFDARKPERMRAYFDRPTAADPIAPRRPLGICRLPW